MVNQAVNLSNIIRQEWPWAVAVDVGQTRMKKGLHGGDHGLIKSDDLP